jgi:hypothetical protein
MESAAIFLVSIENHGPMVARHHATPVEAEPPKDAEDFDPAETPGEGTDGAGFATPEEAQRVLEQDPGDLNYLDGDGLADEDLLMRSSGEGREGSCGFCNPGTCRGLLRPVRLRIQTLRVPRTEGGYASDADDPGRNDFQPRR